MALGEQRDDVPVKTIYNYHICFFSFATKKRENGLKWEEGVERNDKKDGEKNFKDPFLFFSNERNLFERKVFGQS